MYAGGVKISKAKAGDIVQDLVGAKYEVVGVGLKYYNARPVDSVDSRVLLRTTDVTIVGVKNAS
jgi:hypothetical protein